MSRFQQFLLEDLRAQQAQERAQLLKSQRCDAKARLALFKDSLKVQEVSGAKQRERTKQVRGPGRSYLPCPLPSRECWRKGRVTQVSPQFLQQEETRQRAEAQRQQEQQAQQLQQLQRQQGESLVELEQMQVLGTAAKRGWVHTPPATAAGAPSFPPPPPRWQGEKMKLLAEQEQRQLERLEREHAVELSEWKRRLEARKEVSAAAAPTPPPCLGPPRRARWRAASGAGDAAARLFSSSCRRRNWGTRCRGSGQEESRAPTAPAGSPASSTSRRDAAPGGDPSHRPLGRRR